MHEGLLTFLLFSIRTNRQIKCTNSNDLGPTNSSLGFARTTHFECNFGFFDPIANKTCYQVTQMTRVRSYF